MSGTGTGMRSRWQRMPVAGRLHLVVGSLTALALAALALAILDARSLDVPTPWKLALLALLLPLSERPLLHVRFGADQYSFTWGEACVGLGLAMLPGAWLVLLAWPTVTAVHLVARRGLLKSLFNGAAFSLSAGLGVLVIHGFGRPPYTLENPVSAAGLFLAVTVFSVASALLTSFVLSVAQQRPLSEVLTENGRMLLVVWGGNIALAAVVLFFAETSAALLAAIPLVMAAIYASYKGLLSARQERDMWQQLEAATRELNQLEELDIVEAALRRATQLFRTERVELLLTASPRRPARIYSADDEGGVVCTSPSELLSMDAEHTTYLEVTDESASQPVATCISARLEGPHGRVGALRLIFGGPVKFSSRERHVLRTYAHAVSTTLLNAALYDDVRAEAVRQAHQATHDHLTGLANRALLHERTRLAIADPAGQTTALLLLDLDHFKEINDTLGHAAGDFLLERVGERLRSLGVGADVVARLGGDEFAVLLTGLRSPRDAEPAADTVLRVLAKPVDFEGLRLSVEGSLGIACYPQDAQEPEELFRRADVAMYQAKSARGSWVRYDVARDDSSVHRLALVAELRSAIELGQVVVAYQPQIELASGEIVGAEALARWDHPQRGLLPPSEFVGVAEQSGLVRPFTLCVLEQAVAECATWQRPGRAVTVAVNVAARSLLDRQLPGDVAAILRRHGVPAHLLVLEITETTATSELEVVEEVLGRLRRLGVGLSVDDFGTGYSSLAFLQRTAVNELKVDRSFVAGMLTSDHDAALVRATIQLAHSLGARTVAEGVEDAALTQALLELGCDMAQGFWFSKPVAPAAMRTLLGVDDERRGVTRLPLPRVDAPATVRLRAVEG